MKISELSPEERRKYNADAQQRSRDRKKQERLRCVTRRADQASDEFVSNFPERVLELDANVEQLALKVSKERGQPLEEYEELRVIDRVSRCLLGLKRGWVQEVTHPEGMLVSGMYFADTCAEMIESANRLGLRDSPSFDSAYLEVLSLVVMRFGKQVPVPEDVQIAKSELDGTYELPKPTLKPTPLPLPEPQSPLPSIERMRTKLGEQLAGDYSQYLTSRSESDMALEARRYLAGENLNRNRF